jgi:hypothetical protein
MSSPIVIPFNFQPVETSVKTANYTIPVGRYARASFSFPNYPMTTASNANISLAVASISINGAVILRGKSGGRLVTTVTARTVTIPSAGYVTFGAVNSNSGAQIVWNLTQFDGLTSVLENILTVNNFTAPRCNLSSMYLSRTTSFVVQQTNTGSLSHSLLIDYDPINNNQSSQVWLRAGDIIGISNAAAFVEEFNQIS